MLNTLEIKGRTYRVTIEPDTDADYPWNNSEGYGPVRRSMYPAGQYGHDKRPGERPLNNPGRNEYQFYYDWKEASKLARKDGWNVEPYDAPHRVQRAVQADFDCLRRYLNGDWYYVGVIVEDEDGETESLWGVESSNGDPEEIAKELAQELYKKAERKVFPVATIGI